MIHRNARECKEKGGTPWMTPALSDENRFFDQPFCEVM
jgi:hypothetical protein